MEVKTHRESAYKPAFPKEAGRNKFHTITLTVPPSMVTYLAIPRHSAAC
jgi:hypothetical protein